MAKQFGWSDMERGLVLSSFFAGYMVTQVLGGWLAQKWGGKAVLGFGVLWWSAFTILTPLSAMTSFPVLIATRIAIIATPFLAVKFGWPSVFYVFGAVGLIWFAFWRLLVTDTPALDKCMSESERALFQQEEEQGGKQAIPWLVIRTFWSPKAPTAADHERSNLLTDEVVVYVPGAVVW